MLWMSALPVLAATTLAGNSVKSSALKLYFAVQIVYTAIGFIALCYVGYDSNAYRVPYIAADLLEIWASCHVIDECFPTPVTKLSGLLIGLLPSCVACFLIPIISVDSAICIVEGSVRLGLGLILVRCGKNTVHAALSALWVILSSYDFGYALNLPSPAWEKLNFIAPAWIVAITFTLIGILPRIEKACAFPTNSV